MTSESSLERPLVALTRGIMRRRRLVLVVALAVAALSVWITVHGLGFRTSRLDLLNPNSHFNRRWLAYLDEFGDRDDVLVIVESSSTAAITAALEEISGELSAQSEWFDAVLDRTDLTRFKSRALQQASLENLQRLRGGLATLQPLLVGDWERWQAQLTEGPRGETEMDAAAEDRRLQEISAALADEPRPIAIPEWEELVTRTAEFEPQWLLTEDGRMGFIALQFKPQAAAIVQGEEQITRLRSLLQTTQRRHPGVEIGLTGMPILEYDEMHSSQLDMTISSVISLVGVIVLLWAGLGSWRYTWLAVFILLIGMAWSFGFITLMVGHLNILSVSFAAILIGLGIDFGIHYLVRYVQVRSEGVPLAAALVRTTREVGPGVVTGAVTTACAFFAAALTDFTGVVELGVIAGAGIVLCLLAALVVTPAVTYGWDRRWRVAQLPRPLALDWILRPIQRAPGITAMILLGLAGVAIWGIKDLRYDHNLLNLQPQRLASVEWEKRLLERSDRSVFFAVSLCGDREQLLQRKRLFERLSMVERTEEVVTLLAVPTAEQLACITDIHASLASLPESAAGLRDLGPQNLERLLAGLNSPTAAAAQPRLGELQRILQTLPADELARRWSAYQRRLTDYLLSRLRILAEISDVRLATSADLPDGLRQRFVGRTGQHLLRVYARGNIWDMPELERFVAQVESVDEQVTGHPVQTYYASRQMQRSFLHAAIYAVLALLIVLMIDFRNLGHSLLALMPLLLGIWLMLGVLGWLNIPLNAANMIVLPLILGIGIDSGVHVIHDWRSQGMHGYRLSSGVVVAILVCSATTMVGFSSMIFARHQGLRTLGEVLTLGLACCQLSSLYFLPGLLMWLGRRSERGHGHHRTE
ncbi:MAG: MMPL family transporter [Planctomycetota bacterium]